ncbi:hypothetical protein GQ457_12G010810 [Hibiscus cannabinus]
MLLLLLSRGFDNLLELDDKGDVSARDNGSGLGRFSRLIQISAERLAELLAYTLVAAYPSASKGIFRTPHPKGVVRFSCLPGENRDLDVISVEIKDSSTSRSRSFTDQEVAEFMKRFAAVIAAYQGTQLVLEPLVRSEFGLSTFLMRYIQMANTISLRSLIEKEKLNGINFLDWFRVNAPRAHKDKFKKYMDDMVDVGCLMLATMTPELQKQHEDMVAYEMIQNLKEIYEGQARMERCETSKALFQCKMSEGSPVGAHAIKMMGYIQALEKLGFPLNDELAIDVVINMKNGGSKSILMVCEAKRKGKKVAKSKGISKTKPKGKNALKPKGGISKEGKCFHCKKLGHRKRNCPVYLEDVKKANAVGASVSGTTHEKESS